MFNLAIVSREFGKGWSIIYELLVTSSRRVPKNKMKSHSWCE